MCSIIQKPGHLCPPIFHSFFLYEKNTIIDLFRYFMVLYTYTKRFTMSKMSAEYLKRFLRVNRIGKAELARISGVGRTSIYKYLNGSNIHPVCAKKIHNALFETYELEISLSALLDK